MNKNRNRNGQQNQNQSRNQGNQGRQQTQGRRGGGRQQQNTQGFEQFGTQSQDFQGQGFQGGQNYQGYQGGGRERSQSQGWNRSQTQGQFAGFGPKAYKRSDDRIREDVYEVLTRHGQIDATDIEVEVRGGEVTLKGMVAERHQKLLSEHLVSQLGGVTEIHNQVRVPRQSESETASSRTASTGSVTNNNYQSQPRTPS